MIAYRITQSELTNLIEAHAPGWMERAAENTRNFRAQGEYKETSSIWSEIKKVYMDLQGGSKCAYCERKLEATRFGRIEQDVEHYRPKKKLKHWRVPRELAELGVVVVQAPNASPGYHLLAYHVFNYCATCKPCNSALKKNYFPVAKKYSFDEDSPRRLLATELPLLIYPLGVFDDDPEQLIGFNGLAPYAKPLSGHRRSRALTTIEFFKLGSVDRANLWRERAMIILAMYPSLRILAGADGNRAEASELIEVCERVSSPHANCARSFRELFGLDPLKAHEVYLGALEYVRGKS